MKTKREKRNRRALRNDERAVSPVIGVILMVAITVVMAAIIGAFVYGYAGTTAQKPMPAFTVNRINDTAVSTVLHDAGGATNITRLLVRSPTGVGGTLNSSIPTGPVTVGTRLDSGNVKVGDHFVVNATVDGTNMVVIDRRM